MLPVGGVINATFLILGDISNVYAHATNFEAFQLESGF
jgi:hypothetical protein